MEIRISGITGESIVDGPGIRLTVFVQGCPHNCPGCHNPQTHDFGGGHIEDTAEILRMIQENPLLQGITISGGEPFCQAEALSSLAAKTKQMGLDVTVYTGYTFEELISGHLTGAKELLKYTDILIDGRYEKGRRDLTLKFRGSSNQRVLDCGASLSAGIPIEIKGYE